MQLVIDIILTLVYFFVFLVVVAWAWRFWMMYVNQKFLNKWNTDSVILEIKLPRDILKSPLASEIALASLLQSGGIGTWHHRKWNGNLPATFSLEIASLEGVIHFYIRTNKKFKNIVESNFYAQYPNVEIVEVDDYTNHIRYDHSKKDVSLFGSNYVLSSTWKPVDPNTGEPYKKQGKDYSMRADFFPMKTYVDYGLDKDPKEELKTDPITPLLEFMGTLKKGEYFWYQILVQDEGAYVDSKMGKFYVNEVTHEHFSIKDLANMYKKQLRTSGYVIKGESILDDLGDPKKRKVGEEDGKPIFEDATHKETKAISKNEMNLTSEEKEEIEAITTKLAKPLAKIAIRIVYLAPSEKYNPQQIQNVLSFIKPYKGRFNSLRPEKVSDPYDFPWQRVRHMPWREEEKFEAFVEREAFHPHIPERKWQDLIEDVVFWKSSMKTRKTFRMIFEAIFHPFDHPHPTEVFTVNLEELATLWHLPGQVAGTPTLPRIDTNKGVAPVNLPR